MAVISAGTKVNFRFCIEFAVCWVPIGAHTFSTALAKDVTLAQARLIFSCRSASSLVCFAIFNEKLTAPVYSNVTLGLSKTTFNEVPNRIAPNAATRANKQALTISRFITSRSQ
jgi:hypothetical protein